LNRNLHVSFFVPFEIDLEKSADGEGERRIRGYASTPVLDRQNEEVLQKGLDISDFLNYGWFNYDHDNSRIIGYPDKQNTRIDGKGFYVEGTILKGVALADQVWELAKALQKSGAPRRMGFSVEGKILEKTDGGRIVKAKVYNVAVTPSPVNPDATWEIMAKAFISDTDYIKKAMEAGYEVHDGDTDDGGVLKAESLESAFSIISYTLGKNEKAKELYAKLRELLLGKSLNLPESVLYLQLYKGLSQRQAEALANKIMY